MVPPKLLGTIQLDTCCILGTIESFSGADNGAIPGKPTHQTNDKTDLSSIVRSQVVFGMRSDIDFQPMVNTLWMLFVIPTRPAQRFVKIMVGDSGLEPPTSTMST